MILSLASILAESARRYPHRAAVIEGDTSLTYAQLWDQTRHAAAGLANAGIKEGDHVALLGPNTIGFVRGYYAILAAGAVVVPIPTLLAPEEISYILTRTDAIALITDPSVVPLANQGARATHTRVIVSSCEGLPDAAAATRAGDTLPVVAARHPQDPAVVFFTSGTTGKPKGAVLTHFNLYMNATVNAFDANDFRRDDIVLGCLPLFHTFGQSVSMNATFRLGGTLVLQPRFDAAAAADLIARHHVSVMIGVPTMFIRMLDVPHPPSGLRMCISGGAALPTSVLKRFQDHWGATVFEGYGLSETSPTVTVNQPWLGTRAGTVGHPVWGVDVQVADADIDQHIRLLPANSPGEIVIRGHNVFAGYLNDPAATATAMVDGWFRTGDIGVIDTDGFICIIDRKKDLIIRNGFNVYPREVEEVLAAHPDVAQAAVIGVPDQQSGEEILALIAPIPGANVDPAEVLTWARSRLGRHKYPRQVKIVDNLPLGPSHKVLKRQLREWFTNTSHH